MLGEPWNKNYSVDNYNNAYKLITNYLMNLLKDLNIKDPNANNYLDFIKWVKVMDLDDIIDKV